jgi:hypothetical protein
MDMIEIIIKELKPSIINLVNKYYRENLNYKIEFEDLLQQAYLLICQTYNATVSNNRHVKNRYAYYMQSVNNGLIKYISQWNKDILSNAMSIEEL